MGDVAGRAGGRAAVHVGALAVVVSLAACGTAGRTSGAAGTAGDARPHLRPAATASPPAVALDTGTGAELAVSAAARAAEAGALAPPRHLRVLFVSDSVGITLMPSLAAALDEMGAAGRGVDGELAGYWAAPGWGLTADVPGRRGIAWVPPPAYYAGWQDEVQRVVDYLRPDAVVVLAGAWDAIERSAGGRWLVPGEPAWRRWYAARVQAAHDFLSAGGTRPVVWLTYPCLAYEWVNPRLEWINGIVAAKGRVAIPFDVFACPGGRFRAAAPGPAGPVPFRHADGIHFNGFEAPPVVAPWLASRLAAALAPV